VDLKQRYQKLLEKRARAQQKLDGLKKRLGHPHLDMMSDHDLAEQQFHVYQSYLEDLDQQIEELEAQIRSSKS
jgi:prefoldin subunit 5